MKRFTSLFVGLAICSGVVFGQQVTARLKGTVLDTAGMPIPKVVITVQNATASFKVASDENGKFQIDLPPGAYEIRSDKLPGFAATDRKLTVAAGKTADLTIVPAVSLDGAICILTVTSGPVAKRKRTRRH
jgi:hypothetical protein